MQYKMLMSDTTIIQNYEPLWIQRTHDLIYYLFDDK